MIDLKGFERALANTDDAHLSAMIARPDDYDPAALAAAKDEIGRREADQSRRQQKWQRVFGVPAIFPIGLVGLALSPWGPKGAVVVNTLLASAVVLSCWLVWLYLRRSRDGQTLRVNYLPIESHWVQACVQGCLYLYWGWYWRQIYEVHIPLIVAQHLLVYSLDGLLSLTRRRRWNIGFGPLTSILSCNLFLLFRPDWFYWQFALAALYVLGKEFIRWERDGRSMHIFNPSAFTLSVFSVILIATGSTGLTWGQEIATNLNQPTDIYLVIFLLGLVVQLLFSVPLMTLWASVALVVLNVIYTQVTGVYYFIDAGIPVAVFLGLHLLMTDPATSPKTNRGKAMFGTLYGVSVFALYSILEWMGAPTFYDKLLCVPVLNLMVPWFDRVARAEPLQRFRIPVPLGNLSHVGIWAVVFAGMFGTGFIGREHPGDETAFWESACEQDLRNGCRTLLLRHVANCANRAGDSCELAGRLYLDGTAGEADELKAVEQFAQGCELNQQPSCLQFEGFVSRGGEARLEQACDQDESINCYLLGEVLMHGIGRVPELATGLDYWQRACDLDGTRACGELGEYLAFASAGATDPVRASEALKRACDGGYAPGCANLSVLYQRGLGVPRNEDRARELLEKACAGGMQPACDRL